MNAALSIRCRLPQLWAVTALCFAGCNQQQAPNRPEASPDAAIVDKADEFVASKDGQFQLAMPSGWIEEPNLVPAADIIISNRAKGCFVKVLSQPKSDLRNPTLEWFSNVAQENTKDDLKDGRIVAGPDEFQITAGTAEQVEIRGARNQTEIVFLHTTVDTGDHLHQIIAWTSPDGIEDNRSQLNSIAKSFKPLTQ